MSASFWLEAGFAPDSGVGQTTNTNNQASGQGPAAAGGQGLTFNRRSTVSLAGNWGEARFGRDYTPQFWILSDFDPFGVNGVGTGQTFAGIITGVTSTRASNSIGYWLPANLGGIYGQAMYYLGENPSTPGNVQDDGKGVGVRLGYAAGALNVAVATSRTKYAAGDVRQSNIGAQWDFGVAKLMGHISRDKNGATDAAGWLIGTSVPVGAGEIRASVSQYKTEPGAGPDPKTRKLALGYVHNLSKRTALYATFARVRNTAGAAIALNGSTTGANASSTGYDFGIRHRF